jgi:hypothetical protein
LKYIQGFNRFLFITEKRLAVNFDFVVRDGQNEENSNIGQAWLLIMSIRKGAKK